MLHRASIARWVALLAVLAGGLVAAAVDLASVVGAAVGSAVDPIPRARGRELEGGRAREGQLAGVEAPLFSFASPTAYRGYPAYSGLPASDGCYAAASVTGTKGEALTFTRATTRFCPTSANEATGVMCASGEVCITSSGTTRGISIFRAGTNSLLRSEEFDNAAWTKAAGATITANYGVAPDGTTTAERLQYDATSSYVLQTFSVGGLASTFSIWLKGTSASGAIDMCRGGAGGQCKVCNYTATAWSRCSQTSSFATSPNAFVGCDPATKGGACSAAGDVLIWGAQGEFNPGAYATPYVKTEGASATRNAEITYFAQSLGTTLASGSMAATVIYLGGTADTGWLTLSAGDSFRTMLYQGAGANAVNLYVSAASKATRNTTAGTRRMVGYWSGAGTAVCVDGTCTTGAAATESGTLTRIRLLTYSGDADGSRISDGIISNVCIDPSVTRCAQ